MHQRIAIFRMEYIFYMIRHASLLIMKYLSTLIFSVALISPALALHVRTYSTAKHERYASGFPAAPVANSAFMHAGLALSGVGWDASYPVRQVTLISPQHFVCANHFRPPLGGEIRFLSTGGILRSATVHSLTNVLNSSGQPTDVLIGRLSTPMPASSGVNFLPWHNLDTEAAYIGQTLGVLGAGGRGGRGVIHSIADFGGDPVTGGSGINSTRAMQFNYVGLTGSADDPYAESGDSGSPSFVSVGGRAALVGTHTAVVSALGSTSTVDSFLPAYVTQVNTLLENDGYHLTAAAPKATSLSWSVQSTPAVLRAGYPVTLRLTAGNTGSLPANNVRITASLPGMGTITPAGDGWVCDTAGNSVQARRGTLAPGTTAEVTLTFTPQTAGSLQAGTSYRADETTGGSGTTAFTVVESFKSWGSALQHPGITADDDGDGIDNLTEYACGGDPRTASPEVAGSSTTMLPEPLRTEEVSGGNSRQVIQYVRRTDATARQLSYHIEVSDGLQSWSDVSTTAQELSVTPLQTGLENVELALPPASGARQFVRLQVTLAE
jgi:hypothetical protein